MTAVRYSWEEGRRRMWQVARWRKVERLTLAEVGRRLGISASQARNWEKRAQKCGMYRQYETKKGAGRGQISPAGLGGERTRG